MITKLFEFRAQSTSCMQELFNEKKRKILPPKITQVEQNYETIEINYFLRTVLTLTRSQENIVA